MENKYFIDCGFYQGKIIKTYFEKGLIDETWTVIAFEPNPELNTKKAVENLPLPVKVIKKAVWIENTKLPFLIGWREDSASVDGTAMNGSGKEISVAAIDFSKFIADLEGEIVCSMDIEGSEYKVLEKMIKDKTIQKINLLDIEFHHRFMLEETKKDSQSLIRRIRARGVPVRLKVPLT